MERGLTQRELAEPRYSRGFLAAVESGHRVPTDEALAYLAERLDADPEDLRHGRPPGITDRLRAQISEARLRLNRGDDGSAAELAEAARAEAERFHLPEVLAFAQMVAGEVAIHRDDPTAALEIFRAAAANCPTEPLHAEALGRISLAYFMLGQTAAAVEVAESALHELRSRPPVHPEAHLKLLSALIYPYLEIGAIERARRAVSDGLALLPRVGNRASVAAFHAVSIQVWNEQGELSKVDASLTTAREIFSELGMDREIGRCHWMRGYVLVRMDRLDEAGAELARARKISAAVGARHYYAGATSELAEVRRKQGRLDEAEELAREVVELLAATGYEEGMAEMDRLLGRIAYARGHHADAERLLVLAADRYAAIGINNELMRTCRDLGDLLTEQDRLLEAVSVLRRGVSSVAKIEASD